MSIVTSDELVGNVAVTKLVDLCAKQIRAAMDEARVEIASLSQHLLGAHELAGSPQKQIDQQEVLQEVGQAIAKLQFADRLSQRLLNVAGNLGRLEELLLSDGDVGQSRWEKMLEEVSHSFTMESERRLFDEVIGANTVSDLKGQTEEALPELF